MGFCTFLHLGALWSRFLSWVVLFSLLLMKKSVVINSFWNYQFPFHCLCTVLPFLRGFSILNGPCVQLGYAVLALQTNWIASAVFSAPFTTGNRLLKFWFFAWHWEERGRGERSLGEVAGTATESEGRPKKKEKPGALEQRLEAWDFWDAQLEYQSHLILVSGKF